jgi:hypothetical protein
MPLFCLDKLKRRANARATRSGPVRQDMASNRLLKLDPQPNLHLTLLHLSRRRRCERSKRLHV